MKSIGLSVVGSGVIARKVLKEIAHSSQIVSVYSRNEESSHALAEKYGAKQCGSFEEALMDKNVDCIYVATPHTTHCRYACLALEAGKHVICEKPAAMNQLQLQQMLLLSKLNHVYFGEIMHFRYASVFCYLKGILNSQAYGKLKKVYADIGFDAYALPKRKRLLDPGAGGGALLDIGIYLAALVDFIFENAATSHYTLHVEQNENGVDIEYQLCAQINGVSCEFLCSLKRVLPSAAVFVFEHGQVEIPLFFKPNKLILKTDQGTQLLEKGKFGFQGQFQTAFGDMQRGCRESAAFGHASSYRTICLLDAVRKHGGITYTPDLEQVPYNAAYTIGG